MTDRQRDLDEIRDTYHRYGSEGRERLWDASNAGYARIARDRDLALVDLVRRSIPASGGRVVDVGCGTGELAGLVRSRVPDIRWTGIDLRSEAIAAARGKFPWAQWVEGSADRLPFHDGSFDVAVASTLFSSLPSDGLEHAVAREFARVVRPGGFVVWYDVRYGNPWNAAIHGVSRDRLLALFPGWKAESRLMTLLPPLARRLGFATRFAYRPLELIPALRTHLLARLQRPA